MSEPDKRAGFAIQRTNKYITEDGIYTHEYTFFRKRYNCICNFWVNDEAVMTSKDVTDIVAFIISKNILLSTVTIGEKSISFRIEIIITDENDQPVAHSDISPQLFDEILYKTVASFGQKSFEVDDYYAEQKHMLDDTEFSSIDEITAYLGSEKSERFLAKINCEKSIIDRTV